MEPDCIWSNVSTQRPLPSKLTCIDPHKHSIFFEHNLSLSLSLSRCRSYLTSLIIMPLSSLKNFLAQYLPFADGSTTTTANEKYTRLSSSSDNETDVEMATSPTPSDDSPLSSSTQEEEEESPETRSALVDARIVSDAIIGLSDGLTVPFALTAGLSTLDNTKVVVFGGLAELIAGAISMGLGGYLGAKSEE